MGIKRLELLTESDWISAGVHPRMPDAGVTVAHCILPVFSAYVKVFHPIYEDSAISGALTWQEDQKRAPSTNRPPGTAIEQAIAGVLRGSTLVYGGAGPESRLVRLPWVQLAHRLGIPFAPTLSAFSFTRRFPSSSWPRNLIGPVEGNLAAMDRNALAALLQRHTNVDRCFFYVWLLATTDCNEDILFEGALSDASKFPDELESVRFTPTNWFPENRAWLVHTDYDLTFTLIGGSQSLADDLMASPVLECLTVLPETRVDHKADLEALPDQG